MQSVRMYTSYSDLSPSVNYATINDQRDKEVQRMISALGIGKFPCSLQSFKQREDKLKYITHCIPNLCILCVVSNNYCFLIKEGDSGQYESLDAGFSAILVK